MQLTLTKCAVRRVWGECKRSCVSSSRVYLIQLLTSHHVINKYKHWLIYVCVFCPYHGRQRWTIEKMMTTLSNLYENEQCYQNVCIYMSCCYYSQYLAYEAYKYVYKNYSMDFVCRLFEEYENNGYNALLANCSHFAHDMWDVLWHNLE